jgi:hypothetical protein
MCQRGHGSLKYNGNVSKQIIPLQVDDLVTNHWLSEKPLEDL